MNDGTFSIKLHVCKTLIFMQPEKHGTRNASRMKRVHKIPSNTRNDIEDNTRTIIRQS